MGRSASIIEPLEPRLFLSRSWFVSTSGLDANPGTLAAPLRTIEEAATLAQPGDTVYIRGGTYRETVTPARSGLASAPITFKPYNSEQVYVSGADAITGWTNYNGNIYQAPMSWDLGTGNNEIFVNGQIVNEARWPNTQQISHIPFATASWTSTSSLPTAYMMPSTATLGASGLPSGAGAWVGATIHFGAGQDWVIQTGTVLASSSGQLTFSFEHLTNWENPAAGMKFYLTGTFQALDSPGEWYRDPTTGKLYLWTPTSNNPNFDTIQAKHRQFAFELSNRSYIDIFGINVVSASIDTNAASNHLLISNINATAVSQAMLDPVPWDDKNRQDTTGILLNGYNNVLQNSTISYSSGDGVFVSGSYNTVQNCTISNVDYAGGDESGIEVSGAHQQIFGNQIYYAGRSGIIDSFTSANQIEYNTIHDIGLQTTDLGGIYDWGSTGGGTIIAYNTLYNIRTGGFGGCGVYLDNGSQGFIVHDNTIWNTDHPLKVNPPQWNNQIYNNKITGGGLYISPSQSPGNTATTNGVVDLGTLGGFQSSANAINNSGQVAGGSMTGYSSPAFLYSGGSSANLGTLGGAFSAAAAINSSGQIVGAAYPLTGSRHAFLYSSGKMTNLGTLAGDVGSFANSINTYGQVVGVSYSSGSIGRAFLYSNGKMQTIGTLGGSISAAFGINDSGLIVGASTLANNQNAHAFYGTAGNLHDMGTLGGSGSYALAVNNAGQIVGTSLVRGDGAFHAFLYSAGRMIDLGALSGMPNTVATSINGNGDIVGYAYASPTSTPHAFYYHNGVMYDLNAYLRAPGWTFTSANSINDKKQIVGQGSNSFGYQHAFLLSV